MNRLTPRPGAAALQVRQTCDKLTRNVATINGCVGITDWSAVDSAGADFLRTIARWETHPDDLRWTDVLGAYNDVVSATREAARERANARREEEGEGWRT